MLQNINRGLRRAIALPSTLDTVVVLILVTGCFLAFCGAHSAWSLSDWRRPNGYIENPENADILWTFASLKAGADGQARPFVWKRVTELGAPHDANWNDWPWIEELLSALLATLARAFGPFAGLNIGLLFAHLLAAITFYIVARISGCLPSWAAVGGMAFGIAPYIFAQSPHHVTVAYAWHVPLFMLVWRWVSTEPGIEPKSSRWWKACGIGFLTGLQNVYYTNILCQLTLLGAGFLSLRTGDRRRFKAALAVIGAAAAAFALMNLDTWTFKAVHGPNGGAVVREYKWLEIYGLKLVDLVVPPTTHHFERFAEFARVHRAAAPLQDEGSYLGIAGLAALGLLVATAISAVVRNRANSIPMEAWQVLWIVLCFSTGGLNSILGAFGFTLFRTGCRYSVVILAIALLYAAQRLTALQRVAAFRTDPGTLRIGGLTAVAAASLVILWDQVPRAPTREHTTTIARQIESDREFVARMEAALPSKAMVLQLPIMAFPEEPVPGVPPYDHFRPYLYSRQLRFSFGSMKGRPRDQWQQAVQKQLVNGATLNQQTQQIQFNQNSVGTAVDEIRKQGFAAIYVNRNGFPDRGKGLEKSLLELGYLKPPIDSAAGDLVCIPLTR